MTSPLRRKHQITASKIRRSTKTSRQLLAALGSILCAATLAMLFADVASAQSGSPTSNQQKFYRPKRFAPPVHARPTSRARVQAPQRRFIPSERYRTQGPTQAQTPRQLPTPRRANPNRYPVQQAAAIQDFDGSVNGGGLSGYGNQQLDQLNQNSQQALNDANQSMQGTADQWRTRSQEAARDADEFLRSAGQRYQRSDPQLQHPSPQQTTRQERQHLPQHSPQQSQSRDWGTQRYSDVAMPDTEIPSGNFGDSNLAPGNSVPPPRIPGDSTYGNAQVQQPRSSASGTMGSDDEAPALEDYRDDPFASEEQYGQTEPEQSPPQHSVLSQPESTRSYQSPSSSMEQSVLVQEHPLRDANADNGDAGNTLRGLRIEPRRLRDTRGGLNNRNTIQSRYRGNVGNRRYYQEDDEYSIDEDNDDLDEDELEQGKGLKSCEEFRAELLNSPITDIVLDISPQRPSTAAQGSTFGLTRTWTDCNGNSLGTGTMTGMERSYIVVANEVGNEQRISMSRLSDSDLAVVTEFWALPAECSLGCYPFEGRHWMGNSFYWKASALCHKPLYFENQQLERYGHSHGPIMQPLHSTAHFFTSLMLYPYNTGIHPPNECLYALGFYRPGDCAPWLKDPFPLSMQGALRQGAVIGLSLPILP